MPRKSWRMSAIFGIPDGTHAWYRYSLSNIAIFSLITILDPIDHRILDVLRRDGRISMLDLPTHVGLSPTPCGRRVKRMEEVGIIKGYAARIDPAALGLIVSVR